MRYKIKEIPDDGLAVQRPLPGEVLRDALEGLEAEIDACRVDIDARLERVGDEVLLRGQMDAALTLPCAACLKPAALRLTVPVEVLFIPEAAHGRREAARDEDEDEDADPLATTEVEPFDGVELDLGPVLREQLILHLPMAPRCTPDCKGLCAVCGHDKNTGDCGHEGMAVLSPLAAQIAKSQAKN